MRSRRLYYGDLVNRASPLNRGLVSWWLAVPWYMSGPRLIDIAGRNHGTLTNGPTRGGTSRPKGYGQLEFVNSSDQYVDCGRITAIDGAAALTMTCWCYTSSTTVPHGFGRAAAANNRVSVQFAGDGFLYWIIDTGSGQGYNYQTRAGTPGSGVGWHHYCMVFDGSQAGSARIAGYIDGVAQSLAAGINGPTSLPSDSSSFAIGRSQNSSSFSATGYADDSRLYSRALSAIEVRLLYLASLGGYQNEFNWQRYPVFGTDQGGAALVYQYLTLLGVGA